MRRTGLLATTAALIFAAHGPGHCSPPLRVLSTCRAAHDISLAEASRGYPVHLHAVVTFYDANLDPRHAALFVHDATGSIFMALPSRTVLPLKAGILLDIEGISGTGDYAPVVLNPRLRIIGSTSLPPTAHRPTMTELLSGSEDGQWIEIQGIVQAVHKQNRYVTFEIGTVGGMIPATGPLEPAVNYDRLIDSTVTLRGNAVPVFNTTRQMVGARLLFPTIRQLRIVEWPPPDPFAAPITPIAQLLWFTPGVVLRHHSHLRGVVTLYWPGRLVCIQEESRGLCMVSDSRGAMRVGDTVDAVGFPAIKDLKPTLENVSFRIVNHAASPKVAVVTVEKALAAERDQELVQMEGQLIGQDRAAGELTLDLRAGPSLYSAVLPDLSYNSTAARWKEGSTLRLTGICEVLMDSRTSGDGYGAVKPRSIRVLLRTPGDVIILKEPSWWTRERVIGLLAVIALLALSAFAWGITLRRKVEEQTQAIRQNQERLRHLSEHDVLTGLPNRFLLNDRLEMALKHAARERGIVGVLLVDLDRFKDINDRLGHRIGDLVLRETAARLTSTVRATDTVARLGGDEFVVVLPDLTLDSEAELVASKIVERMREPMSVDRVRLAISVSVGVGSSGPDCVAAETLLHMVDAAMYRAKRCGRNNYRLSSCTEDQPRSASPETVPQS